MRKLKWIVKDGWISVKGKDYFYACWEHKDNCESFYTSHSIIKKEKKLWGIKYKDWR